MLSLGNFDDKSKLLQFLKVNPPESVPNVRQRRKGKEYFFALANKVAKFIKDQREHYLAFLPMIPKH